ncbi:MAG: gliding motility-associated C-terminal domain-containing protein [Elusimicrobia bacterium]|nr:gliding motility-associated C-terminal domain-containing protein [Elusimicrobiota bacterium]
MKKNLLNFFKRNSRRNRFVWDAVTLCALIALFIQNSAAIQVYPRILTPNGDGWNDKVLIELENPALLPATGEIFDEQGAKVADMSHGVNADTMLLWDGKHGGQPVPSGIYFYRIEIGSRVTMGSVVVAH